MVQLNAKVMKNAQRSPRLLVVEGGIDARRKLASQLQKQNAKVALAKNAAEALELIEDARFIEFDFDGLIVNDHLPDASGWRVVRAFRRQFPAVPVALLADHQDWAISLWARARNIPVIAPAASSQLTSWLDGLAVSAA